MSPKTLDLGVLFTGDASSVLAAINQAIAGIANLNSALSNITTASSKAKTSISQSSMEIRSYSQLMGNLNARLADSPALLKRAESAAVTLGEKYGKASENVKTWGTELNKQVSNIERVRQSLVNAGKDANKWMETVDLVSRTERGLFGPRQQNIESLQNFTKAIYNAGQATTAYQRKLIEHADKGKAFASALEIGNRTLASQPTLFAEYTKGLEKFWKQNSLAAASTNDLIKAQAKAPTAINLARGAFDELDKSISHLAPVYKKVADASGTTKAALDPIEKAMKGYAHQTEAYQSAMRSVLEEHKKGSVGFNQYKTTLDSLQKGLNRLGLQMRDAGIDSGAFLKSINMHAVAQDIISNKLQVTSTGFKGNSESLNAHSKALLQASETYGILGSRIRATDSVLGRFGKTMVSMAYWGTAATLIYGFINSLKQGVSTVIGFDQSLKNLQAITSANDAEIMALGNSMKDLAKTTRYSTDEISKGMIFLAQTGFTASESLDSIKAISLLAGGTLEDLSKTADLVTSTIRSFQLQATDSSRVADVMAAAINKSKLDVEKLRIAFSYMAPAASQAGISLEETAAASMVLADSGLRASTIGTAFRQVLARLIAPSEKLLESFTKAGADMRKLNPLTSTLREVLVELAKVMPDAARAFELFGLRGAPAAIIMTRSVKEMGGSFDKAFASVYEVGAAQEMFNKQMEGLGSRAANLGGKIKVLAVTMGEGGLGSSIGLIIDLLRGLVTGLTWVEETIGGKLLTSIITTTSALMLMRSAWNLIKATTLGASIGAIVWDLVRLKYTAEGAGAAFKKLGAFLSANKVFAGLLGIGVVTTAVLTFGRSVRQSADNMYAESIAAAKTEESLAGYKRTLESTSEKSQDYKAAIRRLALEHESLAPYIDVVNGKFWDQKLGMEALTKFMEEKHIVVIQKLLEGMKALIKIYDLSQNSLFKFTFGLDSEEKNLVKIQRAAENLLPIMKSLGFNVQSSVQEMAEVLINQFGLSQRWAYELAGHIGDAFWKKETEALRKAKEEQEKVVKGLRHVVVDVFEGMYSDLEGIRRADAEKIHKKLNDDLAKIQDSYEKDEISYQAAEAEKVRHTTKAINDITSIRMKGTDSEEKQVAYRWKIYEQFGEREKALYLNRKADLQESLDKELAVEKEGSAKREVIKKNYEVKVEALDKAYRSFILSLYNTIYEDKTLLDEKYYDHYVQFIGRLNEVSMTFVPPGKDLTGPSMLSDRPSVIPELPGGDYKAGKAQLKLAEEEFLTFLSILGHFGSKWQNLWWNIWQRTGDDGKLGLAKAGSKITGELQKFTDGTEASTKEANRLISEGYDKYVSTSLEVEKKYEQGIAKFEALNSRSIKQDAKGIVDRTKQINAQFDVHDQTVKEIAEGYRKWIKAYYDLVAAGEMTSPKLPSGEEIIKQGESRDEALKRVGDNEEKELKENIDKRQEMLDKAAEEEADKAQRRYDSIASKTTSILDKTDNLMTRSIADKRTKLANQYDDMGEEIVQAEQKMLKIINDPKQWPDFKKGMGTEEGKKQFRGFDTEIITQAKDAGEAALAVQKYFKDKVLQVAKEKDAKLAEFDKEQVDKEKAKNDTLMNEISSALSQITNIEARSYADRLDKAQKHYEQQVGAALIAYKKLSDLVKNAPDFGKVQAMLGDPEAGMKYSGVDTASIAKAKSQAEALEAIEKEKYSTLETMAKEHSDKMEQLIISEAEKVAQAEKKKLLAQRDVAEASINLKYIEATERSTSLQEILDAEVNMQRKLVDSYRDLLPQLEEKLKGYPILWARVQAIIVKDTKEAVDSLRDVEQKSFENRNANTEYYYRIGKISAEEYYQYLKDIANRPLMTEAEKRAAKEKLIEGSGTFGQQLSLGFERARAKAMSFGETVAYIGENLPEQMSSGFMSAFSDFINGTKSAAQAWQDFSRSILIWLAEIIIKMILMNALSGKIGGSSASSGGGLLGLFGKIGTSIMGLFGGGGSFASMYEGAGSQLMNIKSSGISAFHGGGIVGLEPTFTKNILNSAFANAQRFHSGGVVSSDERAIVARKGEGVFTEGQMKALSPAKTSTLNITNITDPRAIESYLASPRGKGSILNVIGDQAFSIKRILKAV